MFYWEQDGRNLTGCECAFPLWYVYTYTTWKTKNLSFFLSFFLAKSNDCHLRVPWLRTVSSWGANSIGFVSESFAGDPLNCWTFRREARTPTSLPLSEIIGAQIWRLVRHGDAPPPLSDYCRYVSFSLRHLPLQTWMQVLRTIKPTVTNTRSNFYSSSLLQEPRKWFESKNKTWSSARNILLAVKLHFLCSFGHFDSGQSLTPCIFH